MTIFEDIGNRVSNSPLGQVGKAYLSAGGILDEKPAAFHPTPGRASFVAEGDPDALDPARDLAGLAGDRSETSAG